jgi:HEPN domain-containing protein
VAYAQDLLTLARSDLAAFRTLAADVELADGVIGLHAQQAIEKAMKAVMVGNGIRLERSHNLDVLVEILDDHGIVVSEQLRDAGWLTAWSTDFRYDPAPAALDREAALALASQAVEWAVAQFGDQASVGASNEAPSRDEP